MPLLWPHSTLFPLFALAALAPLALLLKHQLCCCFGAFAWTVSSAWNAHPPDISSVAPSRLYSNGPYQRPPRSHKFKLYPSISMPFFTLENFSLFDLFYLFVCLSPWGQETFPSTSFMGVSPASRSACLMVVRNKYLLNKLMNTFFFVFGISCFQIVYSDSVHKLSGWICHEMLLDL